MNHKILLLDDDPYLLDSVAAVLEGSFFAPLPCSNVDEAIEALKSHPSLAIVDLFLDGDQGMELSNNFIRDYLTSIPYLRLSSAPSLVPKQFSGKGVMHKRTFRENPMGLIELIQRSLN